MTVLVMLMILADDDIQSSVCPRLVCLRFYRVWVAAACVSFVFLSPPDESSATSTPLLFSLPAAWACATLLACEDDQAPRSFSGLARYIALIGRHRELAVLPVETPAQCARGYRSEYGRGGPSFGGAAVVSGGTTEAV